IMRDVENIVVFLNQGFLSIIEITLSTIVAITVTLNKSPIVFLFFIVAIPVAVLAVYKFKKPLANRNSEYRHEMENTQAAVGEMLDMIPITRAHGLQDMEEDKITSKIKQVVNKGYSLDKLNSLFGSTTWATFQTFQLICLAFTGFLAYKKLITVGEVILYQTYYAQIVNQISALISMYPNISKGIESVNSIGEILAATDIENSGDIIPIGKVDGSVEFDDVCYKYPDGDRWVLENLSFKAKSGESIAFVGDSGSGKSTVLNLLIGFARPQSGRILIDRINMANLNLHEYRSQIAVVPQNTILFTGTIRDNISYGMDSVTDADVNQVIEEVGLDDMLENMPNGIYSILNENGANLSGGQRQRISIARALIRKPKIIIFDEATSALDSVSEKKVQAATEKMMQKCTTFMVAHRLSTIRNADKIAVFENGKICEIGGYDELMEKRGKFYNLKKLQE
ncbi:MAG: ABC transporter ATP-binding protein, partial [Oscillospiraceae bacterium]